MSRSAILSVKIISDATGATKGLDQAASGVEKWQGRLNRASVVAGAALGGLAVAGKQAALAAEQVASSNARTSQVLDTMGYGDAADRVNAYGDALERQLGIDENTIKATQAKLATFDAVAASADEMGGVFDRATLAAADLAAAGFGEMEGNAVQLGKALQDPVKGMSALGESGVTFTAEQQKVIASLVESGDALAAQELLLQAVEGQVKGTAEATRDDSAAMSLAFGEVVETLGAALLPIMEQVSAAAQTLADWIVANKDTALALAGTVAALAAGVVAANIALRVYTATMVAWNAITKVVTVAQRALNAVMRANPIGLVITVIAGFIAVLVAAYNKSETFRGIVDRAFSAVKNAITTAVEAAGRVVSSVWEGIKAVFRWSPLGLIIKYWDPIVETFRGIWDRVSGVVQGALDAIRTAIDTVAGVVRGMINGMIAGFNAAIDLANKIPGVNIGKIPTLQAASATSLYYPAGGVSPLTRAGSPAGSARAAGGAVNITVNGAIDPDATARQIRRILATHDRRTGAAYMVG